VVCPSDEAHRHGLYPYVREHGASVISQPDQITTIAAKREWIMQHFHEQGEEKIIMLDDDLKFYVRRDDVPDRLRNATHGDMIYWFGELEKRLTPETPHAGFGPRQGNDKQDAGWQSPGRMMFCLGYHLPTVLANVELGRVRFREDMDVTLQLLEKGYPDLVCHTFVNGQETGKYGAEGGCSDERDVDSSNAEAEKLAALHPGLVKVVEKSYAISVPRKEVICYWQKALQSGLSKREQTANVES